MENRKGHTLIEVVVAISISMIILTVIIFEINRESKDYNITLFEVSQSFYINEAFRFIDVELRDNVKEVAVSDNLLTLTKYNKRPTGKSSLVYSEVDFDSRIIYSIKLIGEEIIIVYSTSPIPVALLKGVKDFDLRKYTDKLFISIRMKEGNFVEKCFDLSIIEN